METVTRAGGVLCVALIVLLAAGIAIVRPNDEIASLGAVFAFGCMGLLFWIGMLLVDIRDALCATSSNVADIAHKTETAETPNSR